MGANGDSSHLVFLIYMFGIFIRRLSLSMWLVFLVDSTFYKMFY